jgi:hypothetical protein
VLIARRTAHKGCCGPLFLLASPARCVMSLAHTYLPPTSSPWLSCQLSPNLPSCSLLIPQSPLQQSRSSCLVPQPFMTPLLHPSIHLVVSACRQSKLRWSGITARHTPHCFALQPAHRHFLSGPCLQAEQEEADDGHTQTKVRRSQVVVSEDVKSKHATAQAMLERPEPLPDDEIAEARAVLVTHMLPRETVMAALSRLSAKPPHLQVCVLACRGHDWPRGSRRFL